MKKKQEGAGSRDISPYAHDNNREGGGISYSPKFMFDISLYDPDGCA